MTRVRAFLSSPKFLIAFGVLTLIFDVAGALSRVAGGVAVMVCVGILGVVLLLTDDLTPVLGGVLFITLLAAKLYDSFVLFTQTLFWVTIPIGVFTVGAFLWHMIRFRRPLRAGRSLPGLIAVTAAVTLGGLGHISFSDYCFALYYVVFLGVGMIFIYLVLRSHLLARQEAGADLRREFATLFCILGVLTALMTLRAFLWDLPTILQTHSVPDWKFRNNFSSLLMMSYPATLYFAKKNHKFLLLGLGMYLSMILLGSRGGLFLGTIEFGICLIFLAVTDKKYRWWYVGFLAAGVAVGAVAAGFVLQYFSSRTGGGLISSKEQRARLLVRSVTDFTSSPIFGQGLGYKGNFDIYHPKNGAICWYHMMIPQIFGGLGLVGVLGYGYQFISRLRMAIQSRSYESWVLYLSYAGLFLMGQVNPGEFCPIPYEAFAVTVFIILELTLPPEQQALRLPRRKKS